MNVVGKGKRVNVDKLWSKETEFTKWLEIQENLDILADQIDLKLSSIESEKGVGDFSADNYVLLTASEETCVIENQFGRTDHDHLGKAILYAANLGAKTIIWIATEPRQEFISAVNWLNEVTPKDTSFYLVKMVPWMIDDSKPYPFFTIMVGPSEEVKHFGDKKKELSEFEVKCYKFWEGLLDRAREKTSLFSSNRPTKFQWIAASAGKTGLGFSFAIRRNYGSVELFIDFGKDKKEENDAIYHNILLDKEKIEKEFGEPLIWSQVEGRRVNRIISNSDKGGIKDIECWDEIQDDMIDRMIRFEKALHPSLNKIR